MEHAITGLSYALIYMWAIGAIVCLVIFSYSEGRSDAGGGIDFNGRGLFAAPIVAIFWPLILGGKCFDIILRNLTNEKK